MENNKAAKGRGAAVGGRKEVSAELTLPACVQEQSVLFELLLLSEAVMRGVAQLDQMDGDLA